MIESGTTINHYKILSPIGKGGMGEVYLAEDSRLNRKVAIKILNPELTGDPDKLERFEQEAKAASALNHPHILTIYEIGEAKGIRYIATEFIEGSTLRDHIEAKDLSLLQSMSIARQVADALSAAHKAHIIHRDIKPENIMIRKDGYAKVLDFGLAKPVSRAADAEDATVRLVNTAPGMVMGSVKYMSPEQARGKDTDQRTDIWSLGVVLYEMMTGHNPFDTDNVSDSLVAVVTKEPEPVDAYVSGAPSLLKEIVAKSLAKDPEDRYREMSEFSASLKKLKYDLEHDSNENRTVRLQVTDENKTITLPAGAVNTAEERGNGTDTGISETRKKWPWALGVVGIIAAVLAAGWYFVPRSLFYNAESFDKIKVEELVADLNATSSAISSDGKLIAFVKFEITSDSQGGTEKLIVRQIASAGESVIFETRSGDIYLGEFSQDGEYLYFIIRERTGNLVFNRIPVLGGTPKRLFEGVGLSRLNVSQDGTRVAYRKILPDSTESSIFVSKLDGSDPREVVRLKDLDVIFFSSFDWSPDGKNLVLFYLENRDSKVRTVVATYDLDNDGGGNVEQRRKIIYSSTLWNTHGDIVWLNDGRGILIAGSGPSILDRNQLWHLSYPDGSLRQITKDTTNYVSIGASGDGRRALSSTGKVMTSIWSADAASKALRQIKPDSATMASGSLSAAPNGRTYFLRRREDGTGIYSIDSNGGDEKEVIFDKRLRGQVIATSDGKSLISNLWFPEIAGFRLYRADINGSDEERLTEMVNGHDRNFSVADDGTIAFERWKWVPPSQIKEMSIEGGDVKDLNLDPDVNRYYPSISPDGAHLAYTSVVKNEGSGKPRTLLRIVEINNGEPGKKIFEKEMDAGRTRWWPDSRSIVFAKNESNGNLFRLDLADRKETQVTNFQGVAYTDAFDVSKDGKQILIMRITYSAGVVMLSDVGR